MNKHINQLITAILDNRIIYADTNLKSFQSKFSELEPSFYNYFKLYHRLKKESIIVFEVDDKKYFIQLLKSEDNGKF
jgi:hypothetical protein